MSVAFWAVIAIVFVLGTLVVVGWAVFEITPFARHDDVYHGSERQRSPRLD